MTGKGRCGTAGGTDRQSRSALPAGGPSRRGAVMAQGHDPFAESAALVTAGTRGPVGPAGPAGAAGRRGAAARRTGPPPDASGALPPVLETATVSEVLGGYLHDRAAAFLRSLRQHGESAGSADTAEGTAEAVRQLRRSARRLNGALHTYRPLLDGGWADQLRGELGWLSGTLGREYAYSARLDRLLGALHRIAGDSGREPPEERRQGRDTGQGGALPVGAARAGALLERQLTLARTRAHSAALQALGSSRFHAVADQVAVLASEAPLAPESAGRRASSALVPQAGQVRRRLAEAVDALPLTRAESPYNADALARSLTPEAQQDAAWLQVRLLLRLHRYAQEVLLCGAPDEKPDDRDGEAASPDPRLAPASSALDLHRDAAEAAAAAAAAARTPRIAPATAYALGVLHADQRHEVEAARFAFGRLWLHVAGGRSPEPQREVKTSSDDS